MTVGCRSARSRARLGDGAVAAETDSLLHTGRICDAHAIVADELVQRLAEVTPAQ